jgi:hypothetical protein
MSWAIPDLDGLFSEGRKGALHVSSEALFLVSKWEKSKFHTFSDVEFPFCPYAVRSNAQISLVDLQLGHVHKSLPPFLNVLLVEPWAFPFTVLVKDLPESINRDRGR